jgi:ketosteroid isomerase-like protein
MDFDELLDQARDAADAIMKGDPAGYKELLSDEDDITLGNPFGGFGRGRAAVHEQLERAASYYRDGHATSFEPVAQAVGTDLAYTVEIERFESKVGGQSELSEIALRVTCVYRREADRWKLLHRHADPRVEKQSPESVIRN